MKRESFPLNNTPESCNLRESLAESRRKDIARWNSPIRSQYHAGSAIPDQMACECGPVLTGWVWLALARVRAKVLQWLLEPHDLLACRSQKVLAAIQLARSGGKHLTLLSTSRSPLPDTHLPKESMQRGEVTCPNTLSRHVRAIKQISNRY